MGYQLQTADDLLTDIKRDSYIASSQGNFDDPQLLAVADKQIMTVIMPLLKSLDSGWYLSYEDLTLLSTTDLLTIPRYAAYGMLHRVCLVDNSGVETDDLTLFTNADAPLYRTGTAGTPDAFELLHNQIRLNRTPRSSDVSTYHLRVYFYRRPGRLVKLSSAAVITGVAGSTMTYPAAGPTTFLSGIGYDFYTGVYPFVRRQVGVVSTSNAAAGTQTFTLPSGFVPAITDVVTLQDETVYPDVPDGFMGFLSSLVALSLARSKSDSQQLQVEQSRVMESMRSSLMSMPGDRVKTNKRKISLLKSGLVFAGRRRFMVSD